jgi:hypothetical protein
LAFMSTCRTCGQTYTATWGTCPYCRPGRAAQNVAPTIGDPASSPPSTPQGNLAEGLLCGRCGRKYPTPAGCVIMSAANALKIFKAANPTASVFGAFDANAPDMIDSIDGVPVERRSEVVGANNAILRDVRGALAQGDPRRWVCHACRLEQNYEFVQI